MSRSSRLKSLDVLRGFVIILMLIDHAFLYTVDGWGVRESAFSRHGPAEPGPDYMIRGLSHFGAPAFLLMAGFSLALSLFRREGRHVPQWPINRDLILRGLILIAVDYLVFAKWILAGMPFAMLDVLTTIGLGLMAMVVLRRLPPLWLTLCAAGMILTGELLVRVATENVGREGWTAVLATGGKIDLFGMAFYFNYPLFGWLPFMMLGWAFGRAWLNQSFGYTKPLIGLKHVVWGIGAFILVRFFLPYGNMNLDLRSLDLREVLFLSKYPPSLAFQIYGLTVTAALFAWLLTLENDQGLPKPVVGVIGTLGKTPFLLYVGHFILLHLCVDLIHEDRPRTVELGVAVASGLAALMYPVCFFYGGARARIRWLRYF